MLNAMMLLLLAPTDAAYIRADQIFRRAGEIPESVFSLVERPSGAMFCDKRLQRQQTGVFERRFGQRFNRLSQAVMARDGAGRGPETIIVSPCHKISREDAKKLLDAFEDDLRTFEKRYGL